MSPQASAVLRSANLQDGIEYEIEHERVSMLIAKKIRAMAEGGTLASPSAEDIAELRELEARRGNGR